MVCNGELYVSQVRLCHIDMMDILENDNEHVPRIIWTSKHKQRYMVNSKTKNALMCALEEKEHLKVQDFKRAKQM